MKNYVKGVITFVIAMFVFIPFVYAAEISEVNITITAPKVGDKIVTASKTCSYVIPEHMDGDTLIPEETVEYPCVETTPSPSVSFDEDTYSIDTRDGKAIWLKKLPSEASSQPSDTWGEEEYRAYDAELHYSEPGEVTIEAGKEYAVEIPIVINNMAENEFASNVVVKVNGETTGFETTKEDGVSSVKFIIYAKVKAESTTFAKEPGEETKNEYKTLEGSNQEYDLSSSDRLTFRFEIPYSEFLASGKVFIDDTLIDASNYETKEGSTIVVFTKAFTDKLKAGKHTMKLTTDNGEASTTFTVKKTETTKNPKTLDNIKVSIILLIVSGFAIIAVSKKVFN